MTACGRCGKCGNTHFSVPEIAGACIFGIVQSACWKAGVVSDDSEVIAENVIDDIRQRLGFLDVEGGDDSNG